jgi:hypothetical protein
MKHLVLIVLLLSQVFVKAQSVKIPSLSPSQTIEQEFSLSSLKVSYSRPSARGRKVFGDVVPFGKVWRTGANKATTIKFGEDVLVEGQLIKAGEYSLSTIPNENEWVIIFNANVNLWGAMGYNEAEDVLRVKVKSQKLNAVCETFTMQFSDLTTTSAILNLMWEQTKVQVKIQTAINQDALIMASITEAMKSDKKPYFQAANYYYQTNRDLNQALAWINEACKADTNAYWMLHVKAKIQLGLKDYQGALETAEASKSLASKGNNAEYIKNNDKLIEEIKKKK